MSKETKNSSNKNPELKQSKGSHKGLYICAAVSVVLLTAALIFVKVLSKNIYSGFFPDRDGASWQYNAASTFSTEPDVSLTLRPEPSGGGEIPTLLPPPPVVTVPTTREAPVYGNYIVNIHERPVYDKLSLEVSALCERYQGILSQSVIGQTVRGRDIMLMRLGTGERTALVAAGIHGREYMTVNYLLYCVESYCKAYEAGDFYGGYDMRALLSEYTLFIVPCINPDGIEIVVSNEVPLVAVEELELSSYKSNANGVDLNRNFPLGWSSINNDVTAPANYYFKGYSEASEPETRCLIDLCRSYPFEFMLSFHVAGECVFWGDTFNTTHNEYYRAFAKKITDPTGFRLLKPSDKIDSYGGGFENWFRHEFSRPGLCVELMDKDRLEHPVTDEALAEFEESVKWSVTKYIIPEAMSD